MEQFCIWWTFYRNVWDFILYIFNFSGHLFLLYLTNISVKNRLGKNGPSPQFKKNYIIVLTSSHHHQLQRFVFVLFSSFWLLRYTIVGLICTFRLFSGLHTLPMFAGPMFIILWIICLYFFSTILWRYSFC